MKKIFLFYDKIKVESDNGTIAGTKFIYVLPLRRDFILI